MQEEFFDQPVLSSIADANARANPELMRIALILATGSAKTTVMAMVIAWQTINAVRRSNSKKFPRGLQTTFKALNPNHDKQIRATVSHEIAASMQEAKQ